MNQNALRRDIQIARDEADRAALCRRMLRWKVPIRAERRVRAIEAQLDLLHEAMRPLRSALGEVIFVRINPELEKQLRAVSARLQRERHSLRRMRPSAPAA